jgi:arylsulfatase A-like enzyme
MPTRVRHGGRRRLSQASFAIFAALFLVGATSLAAGVAHQLHQLSLTKPASRPLIKPRYLVVLVLDGARRDYLHMMPLPHLDALRRSGIEYDRAFAGILESETPAGHATLSTGSTPARDGLLGFNWITDNDSTIHLFDATTVRAGAIEHVMQRAGVPTIASLFKARYPRARVVAVSGHKYYAADPLGGPRADYIMYYAPGPKGRYVPTAIPGHVPPANVLNAPGLAARSTHLPLGEENTLAVKLAMASFRQLHQQVTLINLPQFDWPLGHVYGGDATRARSLMRRFDRDLGTIEDTYRRAGVLKRTAFVITADHGMADLRYQIPDAVLDNAVAGAGTTSLETSYSTAGYVWLQNPALAQVVANNVVQQHNPHIQTVYYKVESKAGDGYVRAGGQPISAAMEAANQYLLSSFQGGNAPDVVAFCAEDAAFAKQGAENWKGNHGGGAWGSQHIPLIIAGPGVRRSVLSPVPARLEDIAPTVLRLFGIRARGMQGSVLADALLQPSGRERRTQRALDTELSPVVTALAQRSQRELTMEAAQANARWRTTAVDPARRHR